MGSGPGRALTEPEADPCERTDHRVTVLRRACEELRREIVPLWFAQ